MSTTMNTIEEVRVKAKEILEPTLEKYISGSHNPQTHDNVQAFNNYVIRPYLATDTSKITTSTSILGHSVSMPVCIAPMGMMSSVHPRGEHGPATAAKKADVGFAMSAYATVTMDDLVTRSDTGLKLLNLYIYKNRSWTEHLVRKAEQCGFHGLILGLPKIVPLKSSTTTTTMSLPQSYANLEQFIPHNLTIINSNFPIADASCTWSDVKWLKSISNLPVIAKGVLSARDAVHAVNAGVDAVLVSNHGGRQLPGVPAPIDVLPEVVRAVGSRCEVYMDGGVRTGASLFKALALGAKAVFIGRPILWGYACDGENGVSQVLDIYRKELSYTMLLAGVADVNKMPEDVVIRRELLAKL